MLNENIKSIRKSKGLSQEELAIKLNVVRQTISKWEKGLSRWENGETIPNTETLKLLSKFFDVSINTLLGSPRQLICQCCGMPLDDSSISKEGVYTFSPLFYLKASTNAWKGGFLCLILRQGIP